MHLLDTYSRTSGLRISPMVVHDQFYPLGIEGEFITVVTSSGQSGKNYSYYKIVIDYLRPFLYKAGYKLVQVGGKDDERIGADVDLCGRTTNHQYFNIISRSTLVLCGDTSALHLAGHYDRKIVSLFSLSHPKISGAKFGNPANQVYLTPPGDWSPSFNPNESPKQIDRILPETVINSVSKLLGLDIPSFQSVTIGAENKTIVLDVVPNMVLRPDIMPNAQLTIRFDKGGEEDFVYQQMSVRKSVVVTDKPLKAEILNRLRQNLHAVIYIVGENDSIDFVKSLKNNGLPYHLVSFLPDEVLNLKKLDYIDLNLIESRVKPSKETARIFSPLEEGSKFVSNKRIFSAGKPFLSFAHLNAEKPLDNLSQSMDNVIDSPAFWEDADFYHIFNQ